MYLFYFSYYFGADATLKDFLNPLIFESFSKSISKIKTAVSKGNASHKPLWLSKNVYHRI